jgi:hypothetical protein
MRLGPAALAFASLAFVSVASAQETFPLGIVPTTMPPPSGIQFIASGAALGVFGTFGFISVPICQSGVVIAPEQAACVTTSLAIGIPFLVGGVSLVAVGIVEHSHYQAWMREHPAFRGLGFTTTSHGGVLGWTTSF